MNGWVVAELIVGVLALAFAFGPEVWKRWKS